MKDLEEVKTRKTVNVFLSRPMINGYLRVNGWQLKPDGKFISKSGCEILASDSAQMAIDAIAMVEKRDSYLIFKDISLC